MGKGMYRIKDDPQGKNKRRWTFPELREDTRDTTSLTAPLPPIDEFTLIASICRDSFYEFVKEFLGTIIQEKPVWNWHIKVLCDELQIIAERVFRGEVKPYDLICNIPPGTTKSTIFSIMFPAWVWTRMPSARFICGSYAYSLAMDLSRKCRDVIRSEKYAKCFPEIVIRDDQDTKGYFMNSEKGFRQSVGSGASIVGMHAHFIIVDDPIDPNAAVSDVEIKEINRWMDETLSQRMVEKSISVTLLVMQRLAKEDPSGWKLARGGKIKHICLPATESDLVQPSILRKYYKAGLLDPVRLNLETLADQRKVLGPYGYAGQYDQTPQPRGGGMFEIDKIQVRRSAPKMRRIVRYWDKAASQGMGAFSVGFKMGLDFEGHIWFLHVRRGQWNSDTREKHIDMMARLDGKACEVGLEQEPGSGGKESAENTQRRLVRKGYKCRVNRPHGDKVIRADPLSERVNAGDCFMVEGEWNKDLLDEMEYFPVSVYKDQIDAASGAYTNLSKAKYKAGVV